MTPDDVVLLEMTIRGRVVVPDNKREFEAECQMMHNAGFWDRKPLMFVKCHDKEDVRTVLKFVTDHGLPLSIRSGGHSACGASLKDGSVVLDVSRMREIHYDESTGCVTMQTGCNLSDVNVFLMRYGRMAPIGVAPPTGVGGLVLHGGIGFLQSRFGLSVDNITELEMVLADGTVKQLNYDSKGDDKELFFGARGAAGTLGVVTRMTMHTYPMEMVTGGIWMMLDDSNYTSTRRLFKKARDMIKEQEAKGERKLMGIILTFNVPPEPFIPEEHHGKPATFVYMGAWGADEAALDMVQTFCDRDIIFGKPPAPAPFNIFNQMMSGLFLNFPPFANYWKANSVSDLPDDKVDAFVDFWTTHEPVFNGSLVGIELHGGAAGAEFGRKLNQGNDHVAASMRNFIFNVNSLAYFPNEPGNLEKAKTMVRKMYSIFEQNETCAYSNFHTDLGEGASKKHTEDLMIEAPDRLAAIKHKVDPNNLFNRPVISISK